MAGLFGLEWAYWTSSAVKVGVILAVVPAGALIFGYVFLLQDDELHAEPARPMEAGPYGTLQLVASGRQVHPEGRPRSRRADRTVFGWAPIVVLLSTFLLFLVIPAGPDLVIADFDTGIFFALAVSSLSVLGVLMAGWASANKYSLMGALRAAGQLIAYELPMFLAVVGVCIQAGTHEHERHRRCPAEWEVFGADIGGVPFIVPQFIGFVIFVIAAQAELNQTPFDMPVAESELVAGYMTEYSGFRFLFFFMAEFGTGLRLRRHRRHAVPRWLVPAGPARPTASGATPSGSACCSSPRSCSWRSSSSGSGSATPASARTSSSGSPGVILIPVVPRQHPRHRELQGGLLMPNYLGLLKGLAVTARELKETVTKGPVTVQYPKEREAPDGPGPRRHRPQGGELHGLHAVRPPVPRLVHLHRGPQGLPAPEAGRRQAVAWNYLDRFDIDYSLCMYCGICVEVCPFDALHWTPEFEYSEVTIEGLLHDMDRLGEWEDTVPRQAGLRKGRRRSRARSRYSSGSPQSGRLCRHSVGDPALRPS